MSALTPYLFSRNLTSIFITLYSDVPFSKIEFNDADSFEFLELSQHVLVLVLADVSLNAMVVGI